jgi:hypothetical protein
VLVLVFEKGRTQRLFFIWRRAMSETRIRTAERGDLARITEIYN